MKNLVNKLSLIIALFISIDSFAQNGLVEISGSLHDKTTGVPLKDAAVKIKGTANGSFTDENGFFKIKTTLKYPFTVQVNIPGYEKLEYVVENENASLKLGIEPQTLLLNEVVISASRISENVRKSPVSIDKLDIKAIRETPAPTFFDALENVKGVQLTTSSLSLKVPNTRGFNSPNNFRFQQLVDGVDIQAPTLGVSVGNTVGPNELDVLSVEIIPGTSSALYGINSVNGLANIQTKDPFKSKGISFYQRTGVNHIDGKDRPVSLLSESAFRIVGTLGDSNRFAYKLNGSYFEGTDWVSSNTTDQNPSGLATSNTDARFNSAESNPAYDAWNKYGDESNNRVTISLPDGVTLNNDGKTKTEIVRRTGYWEKDLVDPTVKTTKFDAGLFYKLPNNDRISYVYRIGSMDGVFQRGNKIQLNNVLLQSHLLEYKGQKLNAKLYANTESTGTSYNLKPLADNLDLTFKDNTKWKTDYQTALANAYALNGGDLVAANAAARVAADAGRPEPGSDAFNTIKNTIIGINNWDHPSVYKYVSQQDPTNTTGGAKLFQNSRMYHGDVQYDFSSILNNVVKIQAGADGRVYQVIPDGNNFVDFSKTINNRATTGGNNVYYSKFGGFVQASKELFDERLKIVGSLRYDKNPDFIGKWNPRLAIVFSPSKTQSIRVSGQNGYRFPALFEALSYVNNGGVRRVGGLSIVNDSLNYLQNSYTQSSVDAFIKAVGSDKSDANIQKYSNLLVAANIQSLKPEQVQALDFGYKAVLFNNKVVVDADFYFNKYTNFLGQVEVAVPTKSTADITSKNQEIIGTFEAAKSILNTPTKYRVYANSTNTFFGYGSAIRLSYNFYKKYSISANFNYNTFEAKNSSDVFGTKSNTFTGFNTPKYAANVQFGNRELFKNFGFNIVWKWQDAYDWNSPLANGKVPAFQTIDAQVSYNITKINTSVKVGGTNILNNRYIQYAAGPTIGALYYAAITYDFKFKK
jgi:iron complex outermembrane receptor protein